MDFPIALDSQSETPLHRQLYDEIRHAILSGRLSPGQRVPSTRSLSDALGISRATVTLSYDFLLSEGYLQSIAGSGTYVCKTLPDELLRAGQNKETSKRQKTAETRKLTRKLSKFAQHLSEKPWLPYRGDEPEIQFAFGRPDMDQFPMRQWSQILNQLLKEGEIWELDCPSKAQGYLGLRVAIASYLSRARAVNCEAEQIIVVNGSQQAIDLVTRVLVERGETVGIEDPGYVGAKLAFQAHGANLLGFPVDSSGLICDRLKDPELPSLRLLYLTPSHQFPTGVVLSLPRRLELIAWAQRTGTYLIEDDYDSEYRYTGRPVPALAGLPNSSNVIYIGTFSKVLFPALRLGYIVVPPDLIEVFRRAKWLADRHSPLLEQKVLAEFIRCGHLDRHIRRMRALYQERRSLVVQELKNSFGQNISIFGDNAGINVLVRLHVEVDDEQILARAEKASLGLARTYQCYLSDPPKGEFLLNYGGLDDETLKEGIRRFKDCVLV